MTTLTKAGTARNALVALALGAACTLPSIAQTSGSGSANNGSTNTTQQRDNDFDMGWLGLLGLVGLLGLKRKAPDEMHRTGSTSRT
ncbi:MAG TPA: WGxxGxxG family protein [Polaromonas sp.]|uniref:WGxxGxxG family protein n=1 Tax=Polaromonas sp. TaxID=1869339 RepID=UPI002D33540D|nr:WGxxGxxG family protein [Polaromonas sp.]HYW57593.1 WGxxGxxG family protein [Polaromonas sp.]